MTTFRTLHNLKNRWVPPGPPPVFRTAVPRNSGVGEWITVRLAACITAPQPCEGVIYSPSLSESAIQSVLQRIGLVCCVAPRHAMDDPLDGFVYLLSPQLGA